MVAAETDDLMGGGCLPARQPVTPWRSHPSQPQFCGLENGGDGRACLSAVLRGKEGVSDLYVTEGDLAPPCLKPAVICTRNLAPTPAPMGGKSGNSTAKRTLVLLRVTQCSTEARRRPRDEPDGLAGAPPPALRRATL